MYLPAGWFVDRFDRRRLMFVSQAGRLAALTLLVCALGFDWQVAVLLLIVTALCEGTFQVLYNASEITAVQRVVNSTERLPSALAKNEAGIHLALMAGKPLGGFLFGCNKAYPYYASMLTTIWSIFALLVMGEKNYQPRDESKPLEKTPRTRPKISFASGIKVVLLSPFLRTVVVVCAMGNFFFQVALLSLVVLAEQQHMPSAEIGLLLATSGIGGLAGSILAPIAGKRVRREWNIILCVTAWLLLTFVIAVSAEPVTGLIAWGCLSVTGAFLNVAIMAHQAQRVPEHMLGRVMGITRFLTSGAVPFGALSAGYIITELQPYAAAWLVFSMIAFTASAVPFLLRPRKLLPNKVVDWLKERLARTMTTGHHSGEEIRAARA
jgi:MFS family permease